MKIEQENILESQRQIYIKITKHHHEVIYNNIILIFDILVL